MCAIYRIIQEWKRWQRPLQWSSYCEIVSISCYHCSQCNLDLLVYLLFGFGPPGAVSATARCSPAHWFHASWAYISASLKCVYRPLGSPNPQIFSYWRDHNRVEIVAHSTFATAAGLCQIRDFSSLNLKTKWDNLYTTDVGRSPSLYKNAACWLFSCHFKYMLCL